MLISLSDLKDTIFLINFGVVKQFWHPSSWIHIQMVKGCSKIIGTPAFTSLNSHHGFKLSCRDNLEALAYTLLFLYSGSLPWLEWQGDQNHLSSSAICELKESIKTGYHPGLLMELLAFLSYARTLSFVQKLNYKHLWTILLPATSSLVATVIEAKMVSTIHVGQVDSEKDNRGQPIPATVATTGTRRG